MIISYVTKCFQVAVFSWLVVTLIYMRYKGTGQVGKLPILISILAIFNGVFALIRVEKIEPKIVSFDDTSA